MDLSKIKSTLTTAFLDMGHDADFVLRGGSTFTIKAVEGFRADQATTDGINQETHRIKVLADDWDANSPGRQPEKGDQVTILGQRYAIQGRIRNRGLDGTSIMYVMEVRG